MNLPVLYSIFYEDDQYINMPLLEHKMAVNLFQNITTIIIIAFNVLIMHTKLIMKMNLRRKRYNVAG